MRRLSDAAKYVKLRQKRPEFARQRLQAHVEELSRVNEELSRNGELLKTPLILSGEARDELIQGTKELRSRKTELLKEQFHLGWVQVTEPSSVDELEREFAIIQQVPSVYRVRVDGVGLTINLAASIDHEGARYNLGYWQISINLSDDTMYTDLIASGLTEEVKKLPGYQTNQYAWNFGFCFGDNDTLIFDLVRKADYPTAIQLASAYMNDVNKDHLSDVALYYERLDV